MKCLVNKDFFSTLNLFFLKKSIGQISKCVVHNTTFEHIYQHLRDDRLYTYVDIYNRDFRAIDALNSG